MRKQLLKSVWYGIVSFFMSACYFKVITSADWGLVNRGGGVMVVHPVALGIALLTSVTVLIIITMAFQWATATMNKIHFVAKILGRAIISGAIFYLLWIGLGMFQCMGDSDEVLHAAYQGGAICSALVIVIAIPLHYLFWKRHGKFLSFDDFMPEM